MRIHKSASSISSLTFLLRLHRYLLFSNDCHKFFCSPHCNSQVGVVNHSSSSFSSYFHFHHFTALFPCLSGLSWGSIAQDCVSHAQCFHSWRGWGTPSNKKLVRLALPGPGVRLAINRRIHPSLTFSCLARWISS